MKLRKHLTIGSLLVLAMGAFTSCQKTQNASAEQVVAQVGENPQDPTAADGSPLSQVQGPEAETPPPAQSGRNRFGFAGSSPEEPVKPLRRDTQSYSPTEERTTLKDRVSNLKPQDNTQKINAPKPPPAPAPQSPVVKLGFATNVPGDNLHVTLPGEYASLGPISVEKMDPAGNSLGSPWSRGTQMQIPNPKVAGGKIYFKVP